MSMNANAKKNNKKNNNSSSNVAAGEKIAETLMGLLQLATEVPTIQLVYRAKTGSMAYLSFNVRWDRTAKAFIVTKTGFWGGKFESADTIRGVLDLCAKWSNGTLNRVSVLCGLEYTYTSSRSRCHTCPVAPTVFWADNNKTLGYEGQQMVKRAAKNAIFQSTGWRFS